METVTVLAVRKVGHTTHFFPSGTISSSPRNHLTGYFWGFLTWHFKTAVSFSTWRRFCRGCWICTSAAKNRATMHNLKEECPIFSPFFQQKLCLQEYMQKLNEHYKYDVFFVLENMVQLGGQEPNFKISLLNGTMFKIDQSKITRS